VQEAVSAVLDDRARLADGLSRMFALSLGIHIVLAAGLMMMPASWGDRADPNIMQISLGGPAGPDTGGRTAIADRAVQSVAKPDARAVDTPPAAKTPEMIEPERVAKPTAKPTRVAKPDDASKTKTPTAGDEIKVGSARVKTGGAAVPFGGLASQAKGGGGDGVTLDVANFCCPDYIVQMRQRIYQQWNPNQGATGQPTVKFTIRRDGILVNVEVEKSSGQALLDNEARRAVLNTRQLAPLPREYTGDSLTVHLMFEFKR
jgi:periplasmic protein TonB